MLSNIDIVKDSINNLPLSDNDNIKFLGLPSTNDINIINMVLDEYGLVRAQKYYDLCHFTNLMEHTTIIEVENKSYYLTRIDVYLCGKIDGYYLIGLVYTLDSKDVYRMIQKTFRIDCSYYNYEESLRYIIKNINDFINIE